MIHLWTRWLSTGGVTVSARAGGKVSKPAQAPRRARRGVGEEVRLRTSNGEARGDRALAAGSSRSGFEKVRGTPTDGTYCRTATWQTQILQTATARNLRSGCELRIQLGPNPFPDAAGYAPLLACQARGYVQSSAWYGACCRQLLSVGVAGLAISAHDACYPECAEDGVK